MANEEELHVIFGASGGVGGAVVRELVAQGKRVRGVTRSGKGDVPTGVALVAGDVAQTDQARAASVGATTIYFCANPAYDRWPQEFPTMLEGAIAAAKAANAPLVVTDNLYVYAPTAQPLTEDMPWQPTTRKGKVRAAMDERLLAAHRSGEIRVTIGRASDFYGPGALNSAAAGSRTFAALLAGKPVQWVGRLDMPHTYSYIEDFGRGLVTLGAHESAWGQSWHIPAAPPITGQQFVDMLFAAANMPQKVQRVSTSMLRMVGLFTPTVREVVEMMYEFNEPYLMDGTKFARAFGGQPTPHAVGIPATVAWFKAQQGVVSSKRGVAV